jgi:hypothetical protein
VRHMALQYPFECGASSNRMGTLDGTHTETYLRAMKRVFSIMNLLKSVRRKIQADMRGGTSRWATPMIKM